MRRSLSKSAWSLTILAVLAGLLYDSWPLGYWLNPLVARAGLASELEAIHQPFNWLFVSGDVVSSVLVILIAVWLWRYKTGNRLLARLALGSTIVYALLTIADALLPMRCDPSVSQCPSFRVDHLLLLHGICSIAAAVFLFVSLAVSWWHDRKNLWLNGLLLGYVVFGIFSLVAAILPGRDNWSQHYYLTLCAVWIAFIPYAIRRMPAHRTN